MILPEFEYKKPKTIRRALQLYRAHGDTQFISREVPTLFRELSRDLKSLLL